MSDISSDMVRKNTAIFIACKYELVKFTTKVYFLLVYEIFMKQAQIFTNIASIGKEGGKYGSLQISSDLV